MCRNVYKSEHPYIRFHSKMVSLHNKSTNSKKVEPNKFNKNQTHNCRRCSTFDALSTQRLD